MTDRNLKKELTDAYQTYIEGFRTNDVTLIDRIVRYPLAYLKDGAVVMCDRYPIDPMKLRSEKAWDHSTNWHFEITAINERGAHAAASATRCRADGSVIERVHGFYAFTNSNGEWKMYAFGEVVSQA